MKFRSCVEPPEPMRGLEVPPEVVDALGGGKRPAVTITINGHSWKSDRLSYSRKREHVLAIESAKKAETRIRLIEKALAMLRDQESAGDRAARARTRGDHP
jgi:uncharacterized protein YdeI (YjbR/CyaY-like superfamily)